MALRDISITIFRRHHRRTIRLTIDRDRQRRFARISIGVRDRVANLLNQRIAFVQRLHRCQAVVQRVAPRAVAVVDQHAVLRVARVDDRRRGIRTQRVVVQHIARNRRYRIFRDLRHIVFGYRLRIQNLDHQVVAARYASHIRHFHREAVADVVVGFVVRMHLVAFGVAVADHARGGIVTRHHQHALARIRQRHRARSTGARNVHAVDRHRGNARFRRHAHRAIDRRASVLHHTVVALRDISITIFRRNHRRTIRLTVDRDRQRRRRGIAIGIRDRVLERLRQRIAIVQFLHRAQAVVQRVAPLAFGIHRERPVLRRRAVKHHRGNRIGATHIIDQHITRDRRSRIFRDRALICLGLRLRIRNMHTQLASAFLAELINRLDVEHIDDRIVTILVILRAVYCVLISNRTRRRIIANQLEFALVRRNCDRRVPQAFQFSQ